MNQSYKLIAYAILGAGYITVTGMAAIAQDEFADPVASEGIIPSESTSRLEQRIKDLEAEEAALRARISNIKDNQGEIETNAEHVKQIADIYMQQAEAVDELYVTCDALAAGLVRFKKLEELNSKGILRLKELAKECYDNADKRKQELKYSMDHRRMLIKEGKDLQQQSIINVNEATYLKSALEAAKMNRKATEVKLRQHQSKGE